MTRSTAELAARLGVRLLHRSTRNVRLTPAGEAYRARLVDLPGRMAEVNEVLEAMKPRLHLFGHHHRFSEQARQGVRSVGMDLVSKTYLLVNRATLEYEVRS